MNINVHKIREFQRHLSALQEMTGTTEPIELYQKLHKMERRLNNKAVALCNGWITQEQWEKISSNALKYLATIFGEYTRQINGDPRGYTIKISGNLPQSAPTDMGGYFCPGCDF